MSRSLSPRLDSPPPASQFRPRPWSPHPDSESFFPQRRQASDVSVDALDLADYTQTLRAYSPNPYPPFQIQSSSSHSVAPSVLHYPRHRPFSLPVSHRSHSISNLSHVSPPTSHAHSDPHASRSQYPSASHIPLPPPSEVDISQFPAWSRTWYDPVSPTRQDRVDPYNDIGDDLYPPLPSSQLPSPKSVFDPGYIHAPWTQTGLSLPGYASPDLEYGYDPHASSVPVPWGADPPGYGVSPIDPAVKEERIRMLEREFGSSGRDTPASAEAVIGATDLRGRLITQGPKKRIAVRVAQVLLAAATGAPAIWGAIVLKPNPRPGAPAWALFLLSSPTVFLLLWLHLFRGCCSRGKEAEPGSFPGMMVMPMSGGKKKKGKSKGYGKGTHAAQDVQVNLIVDPTMFGGAVDEDSGDDDNDDEVSDVQQQQKTTRKRRAKRRNHVLAMKQEEAWRAARKRLKWNTVVDAAGMVVWGAVFVWVISKGKCTSKSISGGNEWCTAYNTSTAAACLLCITFSISVFFAVKDLHASKVSPRSR